MNKLTLIGGVLLASTMFEPIAASAYDVFSYRYDYGKQSDSPDREARSSKTKFSDAASVSPDSNPVEFRAADVSESKETSSKNVRANLSRRAKIKVVPNDFAK